MYRKIILISLILWGLYPIVSAQNDTIEHSLIPKIDLSTIIQVNQGNSYITAPTDIGNIEPLMFEANIVPNFLIRASKDSRLMGVLTAQIIIRMYNEYSYPVRTPSYMPHVTVYYRLSNKEKVKNITAFARYKHHSNGQDGDFFLDDGSPNLKTGDFSTNFFEAGFIKTFYNPRFEAVQFFRSSFEWHPESLTANELIGDYSLYRWNNSFSVFKLPETSKNGKKKARLSIKADATWMFGDLFDWSAASLNRINLGLTVFYSPKFLEDIGFFVHYYHGLDYYNMYYTHQLDVLRFGIMTEILRF
jgi:hypothetical protein